MLFTFTNDAVTAKGSSLLFRHFQEREQCQKKSRLPAAFRAKKVRENSARWQCIKHCVPRAALAGGFGRSLSFETRHPKCGIPYFFISPT